MTSHDVISFLRKLLGIKKIGHGGTLDPVAAGVLPVFVGKATKAIQFFEQDDKEYVAEMTFGIVTDTGDVQGEILSTCKPNINKDRLGKTLGEFIGEIQQIPPMYSAVHYKGKKLYELARQGITVERKPRMVEIKALDLIDFNYNIARVKVACSKGTYIRTLCEDIGQKLQCGASLSNLIRTRSGFFHVRDSYTLEEVRDKVMKGNFSQILWPIDRPLAYMPKVVLSQQSNVFVRNRIIPGDYDYLSSHKDKFLRIYSKENIFLGIAKVEKIGNKIFLRAFKALS